MSSPLAAAIAHIETVFGGYPQRPVLAGCPHCRGDVRVEDHDLFSLTIRLGNTVGTEDDVKALLPMLLTSLITTGDLDPGIVLGKVSPSWPAEEREAVDRFLDAVWQQLPIGAFYDAETFLAAVPNPERFN
ncbi:hypothetical protein [Kutzneria kofuensis]|uniref:Uncharacterized protein n=1 Tax=Kutzneria kofuensis TaxID=103725 RepID=A0A7W9KBM6_9PSEU|nr:hypothetical protein [Kutzneria kofuensis]MBB5889541.1 hypothetical protein [Kutzneria kofuensis]